jgi:hypothetical protein
VKSGTDAGKTCAKNGPFSLTFCQMVTLMLPHRSRFAGLLLVVILFPPWCELRYRMRDTQGAAELYRAAIRQDACLVSASLGLGTVL